ncbi:MAG: alpha/beta hydrolase [Gammaproteobacteria bacterium]|nr:alpha/beta hydrolase [Gammaproteobacteria bacterium]
MPRTARTSIEIEYAVHGDRQNPAIVLIRGLGSQMVEWPDTLIGTLADAGYRVLAFDNRDAGLTQKVPEPYEFKDMVNDVRELLEELEIDAAHILGISMGGIVAQYFAAMFPQKILSLISVMSTTGDPSLPQPAADVVEMLVQHPADRAEAVELGLTRRRRFLGRGFSEADADARQAVERLLDRCHDPVATARQQRAVTRAAANPDRLAAIRCPTLVIHGDDDAILSVEHGEDTARRIDGAKLVIVPGMGHAIPPALGGRLANVILEFLGNPS